MRKWPPPRICAATWHAEVVKVLRHIELMILIGADAHRLHANARLSVTEAVQTWRDHAPGTFFLPEPSWRNNAWLRKNGGFEAELIPALQHAVRQVLGGSRDTEALGASRLAERTELAG
jgi:uracil-DNA glycosylase